MRLAAVTLLIAQPALAQEADALLEVRPLTSSDMPSLWENSEVGLFWKGEAYVTGELYLARLLHGTDVAEQLLSNPLTQLALPPRPGSPGFAVVHLPDAEVRDRLAAELHAQNRACGGLQLLTPTSTRLGFSDTTLPVHDMVELEPVHPLLAATSAETILDSIERLEGMGTRHHATESGLRVATEIEALACEAIGATVPCVLSTERIAHPGTEQESLVIALPGADDDDTTVVLGAHLDSMSTDIDDAPGADDDASGVAALIEVLRVSHALGLTFSRRLELHFYAAEEIGLVGSSDIAGRYADEGRVVSAMLQSDMNGYARTPGDRTIHLVENGTDAALRAELTELTHIYLGGETEESVLTAGSSDHRSWYQRGFPAAFAGEDPQAFNPNIHTPGDVSTVIDAELSAHFVRLTLAFVAHHAGLVLADDGGRDLFVAIQSTNEPGSYDIAVASGESTARVEACLVPDNSTECAGIPIELPWLEARGGRNFFINREDEMFRLRNGSRLLLQAYDDDRVVAHTRFLELKSQ